MGFAKKLRSLFVISYHKIRDVGMNCQALKVKEDHYFWSSAKHYNLFLLLLIVSSLPFRSGYYLIHIYF